MTREYRDWLRAQIDAARRERIRHGARIDRDTAPDRTAYYAAWHAKNRERRLNQQRARRARLKDAA